MSSQLWIVALCLNVCMVRGNLDPCSSLKGGVFVNDKCLVAFNIPLPWRDARDFCSNNLYSGRLAEPLTSEERHASVEIVMNLRKSVWLGASDVIAEGTFVWTASNLSLSSTDAWWSMDQPDDYGLDEDCVELHNYDDVDIKMNDAPCSTTNLPLCEIGTLPWHLVTDPCYPWKNALYSNGKCLKLFTNLLAWDDAKLFCGSVTPKFQLAELLNEDERRDVSLFGKNQSTTRYWIGGRRPDWAAGDTHFVWDTSSNTSLPVNLWENNQPNNVNNVQHCVCMMKSGFLNDQDCLESVNFYVCQKNDCNSADVIVGNKCFSIHNSTLNMYIAQTQCNLLGGTLAELATDEEFQALSNRLRGNGIDYWIGGNDLDLDGIFEWSLSKLPIRLNWWTDVPSKQPDDNCVAMSSANGKLDNFNCAERSAFMCQRENRNLCDEILADAVFASGYCFKYYTMNKTWQDAQSYCLLQNSHLAEPATTEMQRNLASYLTDHLESIINTSIWIGATAVNTPANFTWQTNGDAIHSTNLDLFPGNGLEDQLVWYHFGSEFNWENRDGQEQHGFICQKAAVLDYPQHHVSPAAVLDYPQHHVSPAAVLDYPQHHVAVLPHMSRDGLTTGHLQVTAGYSFVVYTTFEEHVGGTLTQKTTLALAPSRDVQFDVDQRLALPYTDVSASHVLIQSNQPVTVILYITDQSMDLASSTLIYPVSVFQALEAGLSYVPFSVFNEKTDDLLAVVAMSSLDTDVLLLNSNQDCRNSSFAIGQVQFKNLIFAKATLRSMYDVMTSSMRVNLEGAYLNASQPVAVLIGSLGHHIDETTHDSTIDQILPMSYVGDEYIVFPSNPMNSQTADIIKCIALHDWTTIEIFSENETITKIMLSAGEVLELPFDGPQFLLVRGNASFCVYKINSMITEKAQQACLTTILPSKAWRHQYDLIISAVLQSYKVIIYLVIETDMTGLIEINSEKKPLNLLCTNIKGTNYSGCHYLIDSTTQSYYHIGLGNNQNTFGAYVHATNTRSSMCHPLGVSDTLKPSTHANSSGLQAYLKRLTGEENPMPQTTHGTDVTTSQTDATNRQRTDEEHYSTNEYTFNLTQTSEFSTQVMPGFSTDVGDTTKTNTPYVSTDDSANLPTTLSQLETIEQLKSNITESLHIDVQSTSCYRRTKISVSDGRASAIVAGTAGIAIIAGVLSLICFGDVSLFICFCISFLSKKFQIVFQKKISPDSFDT